MHLSLPNLMLRGEGIALLAATSLLYWREDGSWFLFALVFFLFDLSMLGYARGSRDGAVIYNIGHTTAVPVMLGVFSVVTDQSWGTSIALIWLAHIGFDRVLGYGLKYAEGFKHTHLARV